MLTLVWNNISGFIGNHGVLLSWMGGVSLLMFAGSLIAVPLVIVRLPKECFRQEHKLVRNWPRHISLAFLVLKNPLAGCPFNPQSSFAGRDNS